MTAYSRDVAPLNVYGNEHRRPGLLIALVSLPIFIGALDLTVVSAVLPHVIYDLEIPLQSGLDEAAWLVTGYLLAYSIAMTFMGRLSDIWGRRRVFLLALAIFALGSYLVAVADGWPARLVLRLYYLLGGERTDPNRIALFTLIAARMVQALGGGGMVPVGMALAGDLYPPRLTARPLGVIAAVDTAGWVVGHLYGGIITRTLDWRTIFWLNLPFCALAFILIWSLMRNSAVTRQADQPSSHMDWAGALLAAVFLVSLNLGLGGGATDLGSTQSLEEMAAGARSVYNIYWLALAALALVGFLARQSRAACPLLPLDLLRRPNFLPAVGANFLIGVSLFIAIANVPLFINTLRADTLEQAAWDSGWMLSGLTVPMALASIPGGRLSVRLGYRWPALAGILLACAGFALLQGWRQDTAYAQMIPHLLLTGVGLGLTLAPLAAAAINTAPAEQRGAASALVILFRLVGMTAGVAWMTAYGTQRLDRLSRLWLPAGADLAETVTVGLRVAERVISETFLIAGLVCLCALLPLIFLRPDRL